MIGSLAKLTGGAGLNVDWSFALTFGGLIMIRILMVTSLMPFLVGKPVPTMIRMGFSLTLLLFLYPYLAPSNHSLLPQAPLEIILLYLKEAFYGIAIGLMSSIVFHAFEAAGGLVDNQRGAAQARLLIPQLGEQSSLFGNFNFLFGILIFISIGGHLFFLKALVESFEYLPILSFPAVKPDLMALVDEFIRTTGTVLVLSLQLTAPVMISIFVVDVVLGIMNKAAPSINVYEMGFALRGVLGVFVFFLSLELVADQMGKISMGMIVSVQKIVRMLSLTP